MTEYNRIISEELRRLDIPNVLIGIISAYAQAYIPSNLSGAYTIKYVQAQLNNVWDGNLVAVESNRLMLNGETINDDCSDIIKAISMDATGIYLVGESKLMRFSFHSWKPVVANHRQNKVRKIKPAHDLLYLLSGTSIVEYDAGSLKYRKKFINTTASDFDIIGQELVTISPTSKEETSIVRMYDVLGKMKQRFPTQHAGTRISYCLGLLVITDDICKRVSIVDTYGVEKLVLYANKAGQQIHQVTVSGAVIYLLSSREIDVLEC